MLILEQIGVGIALPAALAAVFLALAWKPWKAKAHAAREGRWGAPLALAAGYVGAHVGIDGVPALTPLDDMQWLVHLSLAAAAVALLNLYAHDRGWLRWLLRAALVLAGLWLVLGFMVENYWSTTQTVLWLGGLTLAALALIASLEALAEKYSGVWAPLVMVILASAVAVALLLGGTAKVAQLLGGLAAAAGVVFAFSWWRSRSPSFGGVTVFCALLAALGSYGYHTTADLGSGDEQDPAKEYKLEGVDYDALYGDAL